MVVHEIDDLIVHPLRFVAARSDRSRRAVLEVVAQQLAAHSAQRFLNRRDLGENVRAVAVVVDHLLESADLAFDAPQTREVFGFDLRIDSYRRSSRLRFVSHGGSSSQDRRAVRRRRLLVTTLTELSAIAALAMIGLSVSPVNG